MPRTIDEFIVELPSDQQEEIETIPGAASNHVLAYNED